MKRSLYFLLLLITSCKEQTQHSLQDVKSERKDKKDKDHFDTLSNGLKIIDRRSDTDYYYKDVVSIDSLKGNYQLYRAEDDTNYFLFLQHGNRLVQLNKTGKYTSMYSLGIITDELEDHFILGHDNGNGTPYSFECIDKRTGKNPLGYGKMFLDYRLLDKTIYLVYEDPAIHERLFLFNTGNNKRESYPFNEGYRELFMDTLTNKYLQVSYSIDRDGDTIKTKKYFRK